MSLAQIVLPTNKTASIVSDHIRKIGQGERGQVLSVIVLDANNSAYDLTDKIITFSEDKEGDKIVSDSESERVKVTDAKAGRFTYTFCEAVYAASGVAWFDISSKDGTFIDTTKSFNIEVIQDESIHINNDNYVSSLKAFETHYQAVIQRTEENTSALIDQFKKDISQAISDGNNQIQATVNLFNKLKSDWDTELTRQKQAITNLQNDWKAQADQLKADFNKDKIAAINVANKNFSDKLASIQSDYNTWKTNTINNFQSQLSSLKTELQNDEARQADLKKAIDTANAAISKINDVDFTKFAHLSDLENYYKKTEVYNKNEIIEKLADAGKLKTVNGQAPDSSGNVNIKIPSDYVKSVNGQTPDGYGNVTVDSGGVKKVNGTSPTNGNITVPMYSPNLLKGSSEQPKDIPPNASTDVIHLMTDAETKYTVAVDIDYSAFTSGYAGCKLQVNNGGSVVDSPLIKAGSKGRVSVTFTTPVLCYWVTILLTSNSSYTGKYSCLKGSKWQDNDTPPEMTWMPSIEDYRSDIATLSSRIDYLQNRVNNSLQTYSATDYASGVAYSKSHPDVLVLI
ncbi:MAG: BppU family phage baseplate upper protein [Snodgrassella sp.]|nr:BppU family phage baseplate upper protein [Snodgrassella sp.]MCO6528587.1 BppU family phage baseplate upper protein [Lactobacillus sp.]